jgi:hypothetical protein
MTFFQKFKKNFDLICGYFALIGLPISLISLIFGVYYSEWETSYIITVGILSFVIIALVVLDIFLTRIYYNLHQEYSNINQNVETMRQKNQEISSLLSDAIDIQRDIGQIFHNIYHEYRKIISSIYIDLSSHRYDDFDKRQRSFEKFLIFMVYNIKEIFDVYTKDKCSVCIKIISPGKNTEKDILVKTLVRDSISYRERSLVDAKIPQYDYRENTAFKRIINSNYTDSYYICNDLSHEPGYINLNPEWKNYYNAALVVPIRIAISKEKYSVIGFLCIDNYKGGFDRTCFNILASFADSIFNLFMAYNDLANAAKEKATVA